MSYISETLRTRFGETDTLRDKGLTTPGDIQRFDNIVYGEDPVSQILDVYRPKNETGLLPVIVSVHGGGWVYGDKERYQFYCMNLAQRGFAVINFTYRLAPEHKFPCGLEDTCRTFEWAGKHASEYGFDMDHLFAAGDSAGANLLELYCAACINTDYRSRLAFPVKDYYLPKAVALNCGVHVITVSEDPDDRFNTLLMADYLEGKGTAGELRMVNISDVITKDFPPAYIMTAEEDFLKFQLPAVVGMFLKNNIPFTAKCFTSSSEKLGHVFHLNIRSEAARLCNDEECAFFRSFL
ncbi:MAG: alpha/beta hydrolase [Solobacterium sp.]|nr:alpha/beta hydrolase [Solobacterium sp.]